MCKIRNTNHLMIQVFGLDRCYLCLLRLNSHVCIMCLCVCFYACYSGTCSDPHCGVGCSAAHSWTESLLSYINIFENVYSNKIPIGSFLRRLNKLMADSLVAQSVQKNNLEDLSCRERSSIVDRQLLCDNELSQILFIFKFDPRTAKYQIPGIEVCIHRDTL